MSIFHQQLCPNCLHQTVLVSAVITFLQAEHKFFLSSLLCPLAVLSPSLKSFYIWAVDAHSYDPQSPATIVGVIYEHPLLTHNKDLMSYPAWLDRRHIGQSF